MPSSVYVGKSGCTAFLVQACRPICYQPRVQQAPSPVLWQGAPSAAGSGCLLHLMTVQRSGGILSCGHRAVCALLVSVPGCSLRPMMLEAPCVSKLTAGRQCPELLPRSPLCTSHIQGMPSHSSIVSIAAAAAKNVLAQAMALQAVVGLSGRHPSYMRDMLRLTGFAAAAAATFGTVLGCCGAWWQALFAA